MEEYMISLVPWKGEPKAPPYVDSTFTERIDIKDAYSNPVYTNKWFEYSPMRAGKPVPLTDEYRLPGRIYWICSGIKQLITDYYSHSKGVILSKDFFHLLKGFHNDDVYESADVTPVSKSGERISEKDYVFIRFLNQKNKEYIDLDRSPRQKRANKVLPMYLYSGFLFQTDAVPDYMWLKNELIAKTNVAESINARGYNGFKMVSLDTYLEEIDFRDRHPYPDLKTMLEHDELIFFNNE